MTFVRAAALLAALLCASCATVLDGSTQPITVATTPVAGADCVASNDVGKWPVVSPGTVVIHKSQSVLMILCSKPGYADGKFYAAGRMSSASLISGMVPYVGLINSAVDASSGAALTYPDYYTIEMKPLPADATAAAAPQTAVPAASTTSH